MSKAEELRTIFNENPFEFEDQRAQRLSDQWFSSSKSTSVEQKDRIGKAYISKYLGLGDDTARQFMEGDENAWHAVGMKQAGIPEDADASAFWQEVQSISPGIHTKEDVEFLINESGVDGVFYFLDQIDPIGRTESPVMRKLNVNADVYK